MLLNQESPLYKYNSENVKEIHESLLQYALDDQYWTIDEKSFKLNGTISGDKSLNSKFNYTIEYKGIGDKTVTKFLNKPVDLPDNFNPIEPELTPTKVSEGWSNQNYTDYTGLGNGEFKDVNFKYNVEWSNVSTDP